MGLVVFTPLPAHPSIADPAEGQEGSHTSLSMPPFSVSITMGSSDEDSPCPPQWYQPSPSVPMGLREGIEEPAFLLFLRDAHP